MKFLTQKRIMSKVYFSPVHLTRIYKKLGYSKTKNMEVTNSVSNQILSLPMYPSLKKEELDYICDSIAQFLEKK